MLVKRRREYISNNQGYYIVYLVENDGQEIEIGRTYWSDLFAGLGAANSYEDGLVAGLKFADDEVEIMD